MCQEAEEKNFKCGGAGVSWTCSFLTSWALFDHKPFLGESGGITRQVDRRALLLFAIEEEDREYATRSGTQLQSFGAGFQTEHGIDPNRAHQDSPGVANVSTSG
jgi:hypothetical protein